MSYSRCSMFGPSVRALSGSPPGPYLLCPLLTSACASPHLSMSVAQGTHADLPGYCAPTFTLMPVGYTPLCSVQVLGFADIGLLTPQRRLISASCSSGQRFAFGFLQIRGRPRHPCRSANSSPCRVSRGLSPPSKCALPGAPIKARDKASRRESLNMIFPFRVKAGWIGKTVVDALRRLPFRHVHDSSLSAREPPDE